MKNVFDEDENSEGTGAQPEATGLSVRDTSLKVGGRPRKAQELAVLAAINLAFPPERIQEALNNAYTFAAASS